MDFRDAYIYLLKGSRVKRSGWKTFITLDEHRNIIYWQEFCEIFEIDNKSLSSLDWIVDGVKDKLDFISATEWVARGNKARLDGWKLEEYLSISEDKKNIYKWSMYYQPYNLCIEDILSKDWISL